MSAALIFILSLSIFATLPVLIWIDRKVIRDKRDAEWRAAMHQFNRARFVGRGNRVMFPDGNDYYGPQPARKINLN